MRVCVGLRSSLDIFDDDDEDDDDDDDDKDSGNKDKSKDIHNTKAIKTVVMK